MSKAKGESLKLAYTLQLSFKIFKFVFAFFLLRIRRTREATENQPTQLLNL